MIAVALARIASNRDERRKYLEVAIRVWPQFGRNELLRLIKATTIIYLKSILVGAAAFLVTVIVSSVVAIAIMMRLPELARRIFPAQNFDIQWGAFYSMYFPLWQIVIIGLLAFVIAFAWMLRRASARK